MYFYPRSPCGERRSVSNTVTPPSPFLSTLSLRRATRAKAHHAAVHVISIHALLAESDLNCLFGRYGAFYFYPRSPCGERPQVFQRIAKPFRISIHALLAESDAVQIVIVVMHALFLSTLSLRRATLQYCHHTWRTISISIHALLAESDGPALGGPARQAISIHALLAESDCTPRSASPWQAISIHALLAESDPRGCPVWSPRRYFYPRSPCGERQCNNRFPRRLCYFYPRSPCGERPFGGLQAALSGDFYPRSPCGERPGPKSRTPERY